MTTGEGIMMGLSLSSLIWCAAWILTIHLKAQQGHWYPDHLGPKKELKKEKLK